MRVLRWLSRSRALQQGEEGQMLILVALSFTAVMAFAALSIDIGFFTHTKTKLQADVDAMVLAGAQQLCSTTTCADTARDVAATLKAPNELTASDNVTISTSTDCSGQPIISYNKISVRATRNDSSFIANLLGIHNVDISACATAGRFTFGGASGIRPFALEDNCITNIGYNTVVTVKWDSSTTRNCDSSTGNYAAVAIDGTGASIYRTTIKFGSDGLVCTDTTSGCCPTLEDGCAGVYHIDTETGNMTGPTRDGVDYLISNTPSNCDTWDEVTTDSHDVEPACRPWVSGYTGATRIIIIPVVDGLWDKGGRHTVTIKNFAVLFLEGYANGCTGNSCDISARFIKMTATLPSAVLGPAGVLSNITVVTLVQ
jgi:hypothetical protein